jgi:PAS domain S-box-containing protein
LFCVASLIGLYLHFVVTRRIERLVEVSQALGHGNEQARTQFKGKDEVSIGEDITEHRRAEQALRESERKLRLVLDGLGPSLFVGLLTSDGVLIEANLPALAAAGLSAEAVLGKPFEETYWWSYSEPVQAQLRAAMARARHGESSRYDVLIRVAEGVLIWIDFSLTPIHDVQGRVMYLVPSASVIDERKKAERKLAESETNRRPGQTHGDEPGRFGDDRVRES